MHARVKTSRDPGGFTIVELLIVIAVIIMLMGILIVAINAATRTAQGANTRSLMGSIKQALVRFRGDIGYLPPILGAVTPANDDDLRGLFYPQGADRQWGTADDVLPEWPNGNANSDYRERIQEWYSVTSLAEYLLGYGNHDQDGYGVIDPTNPNDTYAKERPPLGIRDPGRDGVWGATIHGDADGSLGARMRGSDPNMDTGKVHGPYLDLKDERMLAGVSYDAVTQELAVTFPGEGSYDPEGPKTLVDYWGNPICYYRRLYSPGALQSPYRRMNRTAPMLPEPTLSDVFVLRPYEVDPGAAVDNYFADDAAGGGDTTTTVAINSAEFALMTAGADRAFDETARYDAQDYNNDGVDFSNQDNIVELGP